MWEGCFAKLTPSEDVFSAKKGFRALLARLSRDCYVSVNFISYKQQEDIEWEVDESGFSTFCEIEKVVGKSAMVTAFEDVLLEAIDNYPQSETLLIADEKYSCLAMEAGIDFLAATEENFRQLYNELGK